MLTYTFAKYMTHSRTFRKRQSAVGSPRGIALFADSAVAVTGNTKRQHITLRFCTAFLFAPADAWTGAMGWVTFFSRVVW